MRVETVAQALQARAKVLALKVVDKSWPSDLVGPDVADEVLTDAEELQELAAALLDGSVRLACPLDARPAPWKPPSKFVTEPQDLVYAPRHRAVPA